jgi:hypothetical protein
MSKKLTKKEMSKLDISLRDLAYLVDLEEYKKDVERLRCVITSVYDHYVEYDEDNYLNISNILIKKVIEENLFKNQEAQEVANIIDKLMVEFNFI